MNIHKLTRVALGVALATVSLSVLAAPPSNPASAGAELIIDGELNKSGTPTFSRAEQTGLCLLESVVSLLASRTNDFGCPTVPAYYDLTIGMIDNSGLGYADIDYGAGNGGTTLLAELGTSREIGTRCDVKTENPRTAADPKNMLQGLEVTYDGSHGWSRWSEIFNSNAYISIKDSQTTTPNYYREVDIKDFFKQVVAGRSWEFDWGLEDIKKRRDGESGGKFGDPNGFYYPVQKWQELSWYQHENGQAGNLWVHKYQMIPRQAKGCRVEFKADDLYNSGGFETHGKLKVFRKVSLPL